MLEAINIQRKSLRPICVVVFQNGPFTKAISSSFSLAACDHNAVVLHNVVIRPSWAISKILFIL